MAGIPYIDGKITVFMDDDGQHIAEHIFTLVEKFDKDNDFAMARFLNKKHSKFKRLGSKINNIMAANLIESHHIL